jgi:hypothetical protein
MGFEFTTVVVIDTYCTGSCKLQLPYEHGHRVMFWQFDRFPVLRNTYYFVDALPFSCYHCEYINHEKECNYTEVCNKGEDVSLLNV